MKLVRYGRQGKEKPGLLDDEGRLRSLAGVVDDIGPALLSDRALRKLARIAPASLPLVRGNPRFGVPVAGSRKFIAIGLNYADHAAEAGLPIPKEPIVFMKAITCLSGPDDPVLLPRGSKKSD
jgi:2,4-didehydro-3-deoxy-L-rhamnonate hydrolase